MASLALSGLRKRFGALQAVDAFNLDIADGEFVALLGPSGCGKTTVLRMVAGITAPDAGSVRIGNAPIDALPPEKRNIGLVFQSYALFPHMSAAANIGFGLRMRGIDRETERARVEEAMARVALSGLGNRYPRELSGGQQQRVAVARAIVIAPDLLLFDEPLSNLDAKLREGLRDELRALQRRLGITTLYVTHDQDEAMALADRIVVMNAGHIVEIGRPEDLYRKPRTRFAAEFLGHSNLIPLDRSAGIPRLPWGDAFHLADRADDPGGELAVRPEDITLIAAPDGPGRIIEAVFLGAATIYRVAIAGLVIRIARFGQTADLIAPGTPVRLELPPNAHIVAQAGR